MSDLLERLKAALSARYRIERKLGSGGMATVYLAEDLEHHRQVAIKVLRPEHAAAIGTERFLREREITAGLAHPHILPLLDSGEANGFLFYVMPYMEGESLRDRLNREGKLPLVEALKIASEVADALGFAHRHGVIHRDIKPDNILLEEGRAVVTDFGIARAMTSDRQARITETGITLGTPAYFSPEQAAGEREFDGRSDIYALGCVLYEMLAGQPPFSGPTAASVAAQHLTEEPTPVTVFRRTVPDDVVDALTKALAKAPGDRYQTGEELAEALSAVQVRLATPSQGVTLEETRQSDRATRRWMTAGAGVVGTATVIAAIAALFLPRGSGRVLDPNRVLVVALADQSGLEQTQRLGTMAQDYIIGILTEAGFAKVVDPLTSVAVLDNVTAAGTAPGPGDVLALAADAQAGTVVSGAYYAEGDSLHIQTRITDATDGSLLGTAGPVVGALSASSELVARLGHEVVAALAPLLDREIESSAPGAEPAAYDAYGPYNEGLEAYLRQEWTEAAGHFDRALAIDSAFIRARLWAAQTYALLPSYLAKADTLIAPLVRSRGALSRFDRCRLDFVIAIRQWSLPAMYDAARCMAEAAPGSDDATREAAMTALYVNRPREALVLLRELDPDRGLTKRWVEYWCMLGLAHHMLGNYEGELEAAREGRQRYPERMTYGLLEARALAALGYLDEVAAQIAAVRSSPLRERMGEYLFLVSLYLRTHGHRALAAEVVDESVAWFRSRPLETQESRAWLAQSLYLAQRWDEALELFEALAYEYPQNAQYLAFRGWLAARRGDREEALRISEELRLCDRRRCTGFSHPGMLTLYRAEIAALLGDRNEAVTLLRQVVGISVFVMPNLANPMSPHYDFAFESLRDYAPFQELIMPKG